MQAPPHTAYRWCLEHLRSRSDLLHSRSNVAVVWPLPISSCFAREDEAWMALHEVRLRGLSARGDDDDVHIARLIEIGCGRAVPHGVRVTPAGRDAHTAWARLTPASDVEAAVERAYQRFLPINTELLRVCSDWQVRPGGVPNDHRDPRYDWSVIDRLRALDERSGPPSIASRAVHVRFEPYRRRLRARARASMTATTSGSPRRGCDSYHTVWMQLHEDLLLALGSGTVERRTRPRTGSETPRCRTPLVIVCAACCATGRANRPYSWRIRAPAAPVDVVAAPEVAPLVDTLAHAFNDSPASHMTPRECAFVRVQQAGDAIAVEQLANRWRRRRVRSPADALGSDVERVARAL